MQIDTILNINPSFEIISLGTIGVSGEQNRLADTSQPTFDGALAALETFYHALNGRSIDLFRQIWLGDPLIQLNNPVGGILRGAEPICDLYERILNGPVKVVVELQDIVAYISAAMVVFAGRERGTYEQDGNPTPLEIRTTRIFLYAPERGGWRQIHHHGSIDDAERLTIYQRTIMGG